MRWIDFDNAVIGVNSDEIAEIHCATGLILPQDYVDALLIHAGQSTEPEQIRVDKRCTVFGTLYFWSTDSDQQNHHNNAYKALDDINEWSEGQLSRLLPFASNTANGIYCFDYRLAQQNPAVVFVDLEQDYQLESAIITIASSFSDLLSKLY